MFASPMIAADAPAPPPTLEQRVAGLEAYLGNGDPSAALVVTTDGGKVSALVAANAGAVEGGFDAAAFIRATGGRGGGKKHAAQGTYPGEPTIDDLRSKVATAIGAK